MWVCMLLVFLTFSVLVANPEKVLYTAAKPARGMLNRENRTKKRKSGSIPTPATLLVRRKWDKIKHRMHIRKITKGTDGQKRIVFASPWLDATQVSICLAPV